MSADDIYEVQRLYPQIYLACHTNHVRAASTRWKLSAHDSAILSHLDRSSGLSPRSLAKHLSVTPSTLSASIKRLTNLGYLTCDAPADDKRRREIRLTDRGAEAMAATSVLDGDRVRELLEKLKPADRRTALNGLALLAQAARKLTAEEDV
ncbi:MAG TPA: MarR family winged helix-turn-helix transcriptional regulator [Pyrinomonadaceae bacterium]